MMTFYHKFSYLVSFLMKSSIDPKVKKISITIYRLSKLSKVASALINAARNGKKVTVQIEPRIPVAVFTKNGQETSTPIYLASDGKEFSSPQSFTKLAKISLAGRSSDSQESRQLIATFVANLPADLLATLTSLEITTDGTITMSTNLRKPGLRINWGSANTPADITVKANVLKGLLRLPENKKITQVDLTIANSPIVKQ